MTTKSMRPSRAQVSIRWKSSRLVLRPLLASSLNTPTRSMSWMAMKAKFASCCISMLSLLWLWEEKRA